LSAFPNPLRDRAVVAYEVRTPGHVTVEIYDAKGSRVANLVNSFQAPGQYQVNWHAAAAGPGLYFVRVLAAGSAESSALIKVR
jgi:hypothetical protein